MFAAKKKNRRKQDRQAMATFHRPITHRSFALPEDAKEEGINAKLMNGVLTVDV